MRLFCAEHCCLFRHLPLEIDSLCEKNILLNPYTTGPRLNFNIRSTLFFTVWRKMLDGTNVCWRKTPVVFFPFWGVGAIVSLPFWGQIRPNRRSILPPCPDRKRRGFFPSNLFPVQHFSPNSIFWISQKIIYIHVPARKRLGGQGDFLGYSGG